MMKIPPAEAREMSWWEYQARLWNWNDRQPGGEHEEAEAPDADFVALQFERLAQRGLVTGSLH